MKSQIGITQARFVVPEVVSTHFHIRKGDSVADFGAGSGYFITVLSELVGSEGHVYACEIQKNLVEKIGDLIRRDNLNNTEVLWCDFEKKGGVGIQDDALDTVIVVNTFFQTESKDIVIAEAFRTMRGGGKLFIVDWSESFGGIGPQAEQLVTAEEAKAFAEAGGFVFERPFDAGDHHYGLGFRKP